MVLYKKILILFIIICAIYVLFRLIARRRLLLQSQNVSKVSDASAPLDTDAAEKAKDAEGFSGRNDNVSAKTPQNLPLTNYFVKSSYNSCFDSNAIVNPFSTNVLSGVLRKGYRFIDMEVCQITEDNKTAIHVCINSNYKDESNQNGTTTFPLKDAIKTIISTGLTLNGAAGAPNYYEPLFIHIRIKHTNLTDTTSITALYKEINDQLFATTGDKTDLGNFVYPVKAVGGGGSGNAAKLASLTLGQIIKSNKKCFIIIDKTNLNTEALKNAVFNENVIMSGFSVGEIPLYAYDDIRAKDGLYVLNDQTGKYVKENDVQASGEIINRKTFSISIPHGRAEDANFYPYDLVKKYGVQFATMNFAVNDEGLKKYEKIFGDGVSASNGGVSTETKKTGFVTMASVIRGAATDVRSDMKGDIRRGVYISLGIISAVGLIYGIYTYGGLSKLLYAAPEAPKTSGGGGTRHNRRS